LLGHALTSWLASAARLAKNLAIRLLLIAALIILLPLAVLNRQTVTLFLNPLDLTRAAPERALTLPLFIALFAAFSCGLLLGWVMGYVAKNKRARASSAAAPQTSLPATSLPVTSGVIKPTPTTQATGLSGQTAILTSPQAVKDAPDNAQGDESDTANETRKSDESNEGNERNAG
jgi:formate hydrogenlyase subunit 3/multisubunit Na+/H+ antiporter MnhD subunit